MRSIKNKVLDKITYNHLEVFSLILMLIWCTSIIVEYCFKIYLSDIYTTYFCFIIYLIGILSIIEYIFYIFKLKKDKKLNIKNFIPEILLLILLIISIISSLLSDNIGLSFLGESHRKEGLIVYIMYIGFILSSSIIKDNKYKAIIINSIIIIGLVVNILPLFIRNYFNYSSITCTNMFRSSGNYIPNISSISCTNVFLNPNHYGYYLMICIMLTSTMFLRKNKWIIKMFYLLVFIFFTYLLIRNDTFGSYLAIIISYIFLLIYFLIKKVKRKEILLIIIVFIVNSFIVSSFNKTIVKTKIFNETQGVIEQNFKDLSNDIHNITTNNENEINKSGTGRIFLWKNALRYISNHPIIGGGMECLNVDYFITGNDRPHNTLLQIAAFIGIPGAIIYITFILYIAIVNLKILLKNKLDIITLTIYITAFCYFISSIFGNSMFYTSPYFMILLGLLIGVNRNELINKIS